MLRLLVLTLYIVLVHSEYTNETTYFSEDFSNVSGYSTMGKLTEKQKPRWADKHASRKLLKLVNVLKKHPIFNPLKTTFKMSASVIGVGVYGELFFDNVVVTGLKYLCVNELDVTISPPRIDVNVSIPQLSVEANFNMTVLVNIGEDIYDNAYGHASATFVDLVASAAFSPSLQKRFPSPVYNFDSGDLNITLKEAHVKMNINNYNEKIKKIVETNFDKKAILHNIWYQVLFGIGDKLIDTPAKHIILYLLGLPEPNLNRWDNIDSRKTRKNNRKYRKSN